MLKWTVVYIAGAIAWAGFGNHLAKKEAPSIGVALIIYLLTPIWFFAFPLYIVLRTTEEGLKIMKRITDKVYPT